MCNARGGLLLFCAEGVSLSWLDAKPFSNYFVVSLILFVAWGGRFLVGAFEVFADPNNVPLGS